MSESDSSYEPTDLGQYSVSENNGRLQCNITRPPLEQLGATDGDSVRLVEDEDGIRLELIEADTEDEETEESDDTADDEDESDGIWLRHKREEESRAAEGDFPQSGPKPSQRGSGRDNLPEKHQPQIKVHERTDWSEYTAYQCIHCQDECINKLDSDYARARECRHCFAVPTLDRHSVDDPALDR